MNPQTWAQTHLTRISQSSVLVKTDEVTIAVDPFSNSSLWVPVDLVLITHPHGDHFRASVVRSLLKPTTRVVVPASMRAAGTDQGLATDTLSPGESKTIAGVPITAVRAYNLRRPLHPRDQDWLGYVLVVDTLKVYHAGDTDLIPEMNDLRIDVALLPAGGLATMNAAQAAEAARVVHAQVAVPIHYGLIPFTGGAGRTFARRWPGTTVLLESPSL